MKDIFIIHDNLANKISYFLLLGFLVMLPFDMFYSELLLIGLLVHTLIQLKREKIKSLGKPFLLLTSLYLLTFVCCIYTVDQQQAFNDLGKQLAILLFPFLFSVTNLPIEKYKYKLLKAFVATCVLTNLYLYFDAFQIIRYNKLPLASILHPAFTNHNFSAPIQLHATYFSMYIALSMMTLIYLFTKTPQLKVRIIHVLCVGILSLALIQLASRAVMVSILLLVNFIFPFFFLQKKKRLIFIFCSLAVTCVTFFIITSTDSFKKRLVTDLEQDLQKPQVGFQTFESRAARWKIAWELIERAPVIGHGSGSEGKLLKGQYYQHKMYVSYLNELNAHNEYLSIMLKYGAIGLLIYLYLLATALINSFRKKDFLFASFVIIIAVVSISENILDTNKGIFFFSFFFSLFASPIPNFRLVGVRFKREQKNIEQKIGSRKKVIDEVNA